MAKDVTIKGITYSGLPFMSAPNSNGQGDAMFWDISDTTLANGGQMRNGVIAYAADGSPVTGSMQEKAAATFNPSSADQTVGANQYLTGAQTFSAVTTTNLTAAYIAEGITVKIGCEADDDSVTSVTGSLKVPTIVQDPTTHGLHIS